MVNSKSRHMMDKPYIKEVIRELNILGYEEAKAKQILIKYYRPLKRTLGFQLNSYDFAKEIDLIHKAVHRKWDPSDPNQIFIGDLKIRKN
jgi:hypothetical protein